VHVQDVMAKRVKPITPTAAAQDEDTMSLKSRVLHPVRVAECCFGRARAS
jgi:hypothetical protein